MANRFSDESGMRALNGRTFHPSAASWTSMSCLRVVCSDLCIPGFGTGDFAFGIFTGCVEYYIPKCTPLPSYSQLNKGFIGLSFVTAMQKKKGRKSNPALDTLASGGDKVYTLSVCPAF